MIWENGGLPISKLISSTKPRQNPAALSKTQTKGSTQNSCSILKYWTLEPEAASQRPPRQISLFPAAVGFRLPPGGCVWSQCCHWPCGFWATRSNSPRLESTWRHLQMLHQVSRGERLPPGGEGARDRAVYRLVRAQVPSSGHDQELLLDFSLLDLMYWVLTRKGEG